MRNYLFLSGESRVSMKAAFSSEKWSHVLNASEFEAVGPGEVRRSNRPREEVRGVIFYADMDDKDLERKNFQLFIDAGISCWPPPDVLLRVIDRAEVLQECCNAGFVDHQVSFPKTREDIDSFPSLLKVGNVHRGEGKFLLNSPEDIPEELGPCSILEPYFEGASVRVFVVGDMSYCAEVVNENSWIKNGPGADVLPISSTPELVLHARAVSEHFGLEVSGVDYIVGPDGFHFLEIHQFPGFYGLDLVEEAALQLFKMKMAQIEGEA